MVKSGYASTCSGWFSERSACYLASGRPVVVQDTGFSQFLPVGAGLHAFNNQDEAVEAIRQIELLGTRNIIVRTAELSESARAIASMFSPDL